MNGGHRTAANHAAGRMPNDGPFIALIGGAAAFVTWLWTVGQVSGRLAGGRWPDVGAGDMGRVMVSFPKHASDPQLAWPPAAQKLLPGPVGFYMVGALLAVLAGVAVYFGFRLFQTVGRPRTGDSRDAHWATSRDLKPLVVKAPTRGRLSLGFSGRSLVAAEKRQSVLVVGPTQTGKTTALAIPAILEWDGPVIATSIKTDLLRDTLAARSTRGGPV